MKKFNYKIFQGNRVYQKIGSDRGISKLWIWDKVQLRYNIPERGNSYYARKSFLSNGKKVRKTESFATIEQARDWLLKPSLNVESQDVTHKLNIVFGDVINKFREVRYRSLRQGTIDLYERHLRLYFSPLIDIPLCDFNSGVVDNWLSGLMKQQENGNFKTTRTSFEHELQLLTTLLSFCREYFDEFSNLNPIKKRHREVTIIKSSTPKEKYLDVEKFLDFRNKLISKDNGDLYYHLATVQYFQALRISEVCAIKWENIKLDIENPAQSELEVKESVYWPRKKGRIAEIQNGFKNSKRMKDGKKVSTLLPETYKSLLALSKLKNSELVFNNDGMILEYRQIQHAYDCAFKDSKLSMRGTHIMRHGGASLAFNKSNGNLAVAAAQLGNTVTVAQTYSHLDRNTQKSFATQIWEEDKAANGCK